MNWMWRDRLMSIGVVLAAMGGYVVWQALMRVSGASRGVEWAIASVVVLGSVGWVTLSILRDASSHPDGLALAGLPAVTLRGLEPAVLGGITLPATQRAGWRFADPTEIIFESDVKHLAQRVRPVVERALIEILENPLANPLSVVSGRTVRIKRIEPAAAGDETAPPLLLAYSTVPRQRLIKTLALGRAEAASGAVMSGDEETVEALYSLVETVKNRAYNGSGAPALEH